MKVIYKKTGQLKNVSFGHGVNYLIPQGLAVLATNENIKAYQEKEKQAKKAGKKTEAEQVKKTREFAGKTFNIKAKIGEKGRLFGAISKKKLSSELGVDKTEIILPKPIKKSGEHQLALKFGSKQVKVKLKIIDIK